MSCKKKLPVDLIIEDERLFDTSMMLKKANPGDAGFDVRACISERIILTGGSSVLIDLGFKMHINDPGYCAVLLPRSGNGHNKGVVLGNLVGLIDSQYQGTVKASVWNRNHAKTVVIEPMDKIAQLVFLPIPEVQFNMVDSFNDESERGEGGFGSTGVA